MNNVEHEHVQWSVEKAVKFVLRIMENDRTLVWRSLDDSQFDRMLFGNPKQSLL